MIRVVRWWLLGAGVVTLGGCDTVPSGPGGFPAAPTSVTTFTGPEYDEITVVWPDVSGATSYNLYWGTTPALTRQNGTKVAGVSQQFAHSGLMPNTTYYYIVTAANTAGEGAAST